MSIFEDLIEELKEENLIEETVIETSRIEQEKINERQKSQEQKLTENPDSLESAKSIQAESENSNKEKNSLLPAEKYSDKTALTENSLINENLIAEIKESQPLNEAETPVESEVKGEEFYRRRAAEEVVSLQIVEHILTGVEREQIKVAPKSYNDISVNMALHDFLHNTNSPDSAEHSLAEFRLMQETENWYSALLHRDKFISAGDLRRYCEATRPVLSSQALVSLGRFYRNAPFTDSVRNKFDMVMTRLVTKEINNNKRELLVERNELVNQISGLYADWSSIPLYDDGNTEIALILLKFEDFINEAEETGSFEQLVNSDFFNRLRIYKDSTGENFYSPEVAASAIYCNVVVGNRYVELVEAERELNNAKSLEEKYKFLLDQTVSDATSKTLQLINLLQAKKDNAEESEAKLPEITEVKEKPPVHRSREQPVIIESEKDSKFLSLKINKWLIVLALAVILLIALVYLGSEKLYSQPPISTTVEKVNLEKSNLEKYFKTAKIDGDTYYAITQPVWEELSKETKETVLRKILEDGEKDGYKKIHLINVDGKTIGFVSEEKGIELAGI